MRKVSHTFIIQSTAVFVTEIHIFFRKNLVMGPTPKHIQNKLMDLLAVNGQIDRDIEAADKAIQNAMTQLGNAKERSERVKSLAVEIRDSKLVKDKDE